MKISSLLFVLFCSACSTQAHSQVANKLEKDSASVANAGLATSFQESLKETRSTGVMNDSKRHSDTPKEIKTDKVNTVDIKLHTDTYVIEQEPTNKAEVFDPGKNVEISRAENIQSIHINIKPSEQAYLRYILMTIVALISASSLITNILLWKKDKKYSLKEQFWLRDILMVDLNKSFKILSNIASSAPSHRNVSKFNNYYREKIAPKRSSLIGVAKTIQKIHPELYVVLIHHIIKIDDAFYNDDGDLLDKKLYLREIDCIWSNICGSIYQYQTR